ncbi:uncharacterized protein LOC110037444 [Phalaenopsis equestris]|uniref:uncharacterized protein LOC110037444 n=1 Tax=Phalaenopsis equestris TaxID=78828 RepID=UPI0009E2BD2A|nr:uncharacterized protein LOC110037444 [Phalaenopsis equestris]
MSTFCDSISSAGLFELGFKGPEFTWKRGHLWGKLDRFLVNDYWQSQFMLTFVTHLSLAGSDHRPLLISITSFQLPPTPSPFRYLNMWSSHPLFPKIIFEHWFDISHPDPLVKLSLLQIKTGKALQKWNWEAFGNVFTKVTGAEINVTKVEQEAQQGFVGEEELLSAHNILLNAIEYQDQFLKQKPAMNIFTDGERNTKFYHAYIKYKRKLQNTRLPIETHYFSDELSCTNNLNLIDPHTTKEIWEASSSIDSSKVAAPDGYVADFYKKSWDTIKADVIAAVGRSIIDNALLTHELLHDLNKPCRGGNLIYKLDMKKAYDTISWDFILEILTARGFHTSFCQLIHIQLNNNAHSILLNGRTWGSFTATRGLKQGDPLFPTIFILAIYYLSRMIDAALLPQNYSRYHHSSNIPISHLFYADGIMVFSSAHKNAVKKVFQSLKKFQLHSGMQFNVDKCQLIFNKKASSNCKQWATAYTGFSYTQLPIKYLGVTLLTGRTKHIQFEEVLNKISSFLSGWTQSFLYNGGRIT